jgi:hypothetical protein
MMTLRFRDLGQTLDDFRREYLVRCPQCGERAQVVPRAGETLAAPVARRLVCAHCGLTKDRAAAYPPRAQDAWYDQLELWLQTPCGGETLWAYNQEHLDFLEQYVAAPLRERAHPDGSTLSQTGARNSTLASRLPAWIKSAKNRDDVLKCIGKLRRMLE